MSRAPNRVLNEDEIEYFLNKSDIEDFVPSDEDLGDIEYVLTRADEESSSSSSSFESEKENAETNRRQRTRGGRTRGRSNNRRPVRRETEAQIPNNNIPSTSGSTAQENWSVKSFTPKTLNLTEPTYLPIHSQEYDKLDYFKQYIDDDLVKIIVEKTNQTSVYTTGKSLELTYRECYIYIGICLAMASINYPILRMYWETKFRIALIADAMPRNRFLLLRNSLKIVFDEDITADLRAKDKLWRVRPLINKIKSACREQIKEQCLSIDEMIIPFTGNCGIRIYCPGKPNPVGIKAFVLANPNGMICDFDIYEGSTTYPQFEDKGFGLGEKAILALTETLVPGHILYCDRYFTSEKLLDELRKRGIGCTGTLMKNRIPKDVRDLLMSDKDLKKRGRGTSQVVVRKDDNVSVTKWFDNKPVVLMSSVEAKEEEDTCQRWCKKQKKYVTVKRPRCVRQYNSNMGGVDLADRLLAVCPNRYRTRKWTQRFISHMIDLSTSNAWLLFKQDQIKKGAKKICQLRHFKLELGEYLIEKYSIKESVLESEEEEIGAGDPPNKKARGMPSTPLPSLMKRRTEAKHLPVMVEVQGRCRQCHENKTFFQCSSCNIRLCLTKKRNCYLSFHNN